MSDKLKNTLTALFLFCAISSYAGGLEKGFEALGVKDYFKALKYFDKVMFKSPAGGAYGKSLIYAEEKSAFFQLDSALKYVLFADSAYISSSDRIKDQLRQLDIDLESIRRQKVVIADVAYDKMRGSSDLTLYEGYLKKYTFSPSYVSIVRTRDSLALEEAKAVGDHKAFRKYIIDYPGSAFRQEADSLYSLRFYKEQTHEGDMETFKRFVKEFSTNPHADEAFDIIYDSVREVDTKEEYYNHIREYPNSPYIEDAWQRIIDLYLWDYSKEALATLIWDYPDNIFKEEVEEELKFLYSPRFEVYLDDGIQLIDAQGNMITKRSYDSVQNYKEGLAVVTKDGKSGYINKIGEEVIPLKYDDAFNFSEGMCVVEKNGRYGALNRRGEVMIPFEYSELGHFSSGLIPSTKGSGFIYLDKNGELGVDDIYEEASDFKGGFAMVKIDGMYALINEYGEIVLPSDYDWVEPFQKGLARVKQGEFFGLYRLDQGLVLDVTYDKISSKSENGLRLVVKDGSFGYVDESGEIVIPMEFDFIPERTLRESFFHFGYAKLSKDGLYGVINENGETVVPFSYKELGDISSSIIWYKEQNRYGYLDFTGNKLRADYEIASDFDQGVAVAGKEGALGLLNVRGEWLIQPVYGSLRSVKDTEYCVFEQSGQLGVVHRDGKEVLVGNYDSIDILNLRFAKLRQGDKVYYYDLDNNKEVYMAER